MTTLVLAFIRICLKTNYNLLPFQILFTEFVDWALEKNLDIEDDADEAPTEDAPAEEAE